MSALLYISIEVKDAKSLKNKTVNIELNFPTQGKVGNNIGKKSAIGRVGRWNPRIGTKNVAEISKEKIQLGPV